MSEFDSSTFIIEPEALTRPEVLGVYPLPIFANQQNTGDRLQQTANLAGFPIIASDLVLQSRRTIFDMKAREANQPSGDTYVTMSKHRADYVAKWAEAFEPEVLLGIADSLAVPVVQGMQLHGEADIRFDAMLLRDGWNLGNPTGIVRGIARYARYQVKDALHSRKEPHNFDIPDFGNNTIEPSAPDETNPIAKLRNVADLMRGPENRDNAVKLVAARGLALNIRCLRNGLSGTPEQQDKFVDQLQVERIKQLLVNKQGMLGFSAGIDEGWHSDLLDPARASKDINDTLDLLTQPY